MPDAPDVFAAAPPWFGVAFALILVIGIVSVVANLSKTLGAGRNPLTLETDIQLSALDALEKIGGSPAEPVEGVKLAPESSIEARLAVLDDLLARKVITGAEHASGRMMILGS